MYLKGKADIWFHGFIASHPHANWTLFSEELSKRFFETTGEEVIEIFSKIKQFGSISEYQEKFEDLKSQVMLSLPQLPESYYFENQKGYPLLGPMITEFHYKEGHNRSKLSHIDALSSKRLK